MENYDTIVENYSLPSKGLVYNPPIEAEGTIRSMRVAEEMKRLSPTDKPYKLMSEIIEDCMKEKPTVHVYDMCMADYQYLLQRLRVATYGPDYKFSVKCPHCGEIFDFKLSLDDIGVSVLETLDDIPTEIELPRTHRKISLKMQTPRSMDEMLERQKKIFEQNPDATDQTLLFTMTNSIAAIDGKATNQVVVENLIRNLPMMDSNYILKKINKLNDAIGLQLDLECECEHCKSKFTAPFRISSEFFGPEID